jgi:conjugative transfer signal peptidase TraF
MLDRRAAAIGASALLAATIVAPPPPLLVWNASASMPVGLYFVAPGKSVHVGDIVAARLPDRAGRLAAHRRYLPFGLPIVKPVAAAAGDQICAIGGALFVNGMRTATRLRRDGKGRPLPAWTGCIRLGTRQLFLLANRSRASFDSRYFGPIGQDLVIGPARLIWAA